MYIIYTLCVYVCGYKYKKEASLNTLFCREDNRLGYDS